MRSSHYPYKASTIQARLNISHLFIFAAGVLPVSSVALHSLGWIDIRMMILPNILMLSFCCYHIVNGTQLKRTIFNGWTGGLIAVLLYDMSRIPFIYLGWDDFIPALGGWISGSEENFLVGYLWRYLGNGAGLGVCFALLHQLFNFRKVVLAGTLFGLAVFFCLDLVLMFSEHAQGMMFKITPLTFTGSMVGHIVFGFVLGMYFKQRTK